MHLSRDCQGRCERSTPQLSRGDAFLLQCCDEFSHQLENGQPRSKSWIALAGWLVSTGIFSWLASLWTALASQGTAAIILVGVFLGSLFVIAIAKAYEVADKVIAKKSAHVLRAPVSFDDEINYADDAEDIAPDKQAYNDLIAFSIDFLLPACDEQIQLQEALLNATSPNEEIATLATIGLRSDYRYKVSDFWKNYERLSSGLAESPGPIIRFNAIVDCIHQLEKGGYKRFCARSHDLEAAVDHPATTCRHN